MKALLLCAGLWTRLYPISYQVAKNMIKIAGTHYWNILLMTCVKQRFDIRIVVGNLKEKIIEYFEDGLKFGVNKKYLQQNNLLIQALILTAKKFVKDEPFFIYLTDTSKMNKIILSNTLKK